jgi:hypothetical protein
MQVGVQRSRQLGDTLPDRRRRASNRSCNNFPPTRRRLTLGNFLLAHLTPTTPGRVCGTPKSRAEPPPNGDPVVHVETLTRGLNIADPAEVAAYKKAFAQLRQLAVAGAEAQALLRRIITSS